MEGRVPRGGAEGLGVMGHGLREGVCLLACCTLIE